MSPVPELSVVVPARDEAANLPELHRRLVAALEGTVRDWELVLVDDGSTDGTAEVAAGLCAADPRVRLVELSRNFGKEMALLAGYDHARGRAVVTMDADLQNPPEVVPELVARWREGFEIVDAVRRRTEGVGPVRRAASRWFYRAMRRLADTEILPDSADFRLLDRAAVDAIRSCRERFRFNRGLAGWVGFRRTSVPFDAAARRGGRSAWSTWRLVGYAMDALFAFSSLPLRLAGLAGLALSLLSFAYMAWLVVDNLARGLPIPGYATVAGGIFLLGGMNLLGIWILGEYIGRIYEETKGRPPYVVRRVLGPTPSPPPEAG